ncbi:hypothetical protein MSPP1_002079 [Malassezia sp. CBS 17886]|nr:hypothetical protein MSPP1_002079 [Malassezia sp. CBS 17886]
MDSVALPSAAAPCVPPEPRGAHARVGFICERDRLAHDVYQSVLSSGRGDWIDLLHCAPLASQYHLSTYSVLKFGTMGAPYAYLPFSLQQPDIAQGIVVRQREAETTAWRWVRCAHDEPAPLFSDAQLSDADPGTLRASSVSHTPDGVAAAHHCATDTLDGVARVLGGLCGSEREAITVDLQDAMGSSCLGTKRGRASFVAADSAADAVKTSGSHPIHVSHIVPPSLLPDIAERLAARLAGDGRAGTAGTGDRVAADAHAAVLGPDAPPRSVAQDPEEHVLRQVRGEELIRLPPSMQLDECVEAPCARPGEKAANADAINGCSGLAKAAEPCAIGNLLLSSCPGKKVRLEGAVRGRGAICRDLKMDLVRFRKIGVRAIVCCLDDDELNLLGSPCKEYLREVELQGLDLIRLPIAEGFAPTDLVRFDVVMTNLIQNYTLRGASILVHCRGGVGRAGLVACGWILKMGLAAADSTVRRRACLLSADLVPESTQILQTVLKLISVVRKRRSPRAIETAEQAQFLMEYVRFIHSQEHAQRCFASCSQAAK